MVRPPKRDDPNFDKSDDLSTRPVLELDKFYSQMLDVKLSDEKALEYMTFAAKLAQVNFKNQEEMLSFRNDFNQALKFITILDGVDVKGQEPLGNVLEIYGGNSGKLRTAEDFIHVEDDQNYGIDFKTELAHLSKHYKDGYV